VFLVELSDGFSLLPRNFWNAKMLGSSLSTGKYYQQENINMLNIINRKRERERERERERD
jgi:hypothetical protein